MFEIQPGPTDKDLIGLDYLEKVENKMSDSTAVLEGYTEEYMLHSGGGLYEFPILVKPGTDLESRFRAWSTDDQEFIIVTGSSCYFEKLESARSNIH